MDTTNSTEKKARAARTPKSVIEERYAVFKDLAKEKLTFDEMVEVTGFPESQVERSSSRCSRKSKTPLNDSEGVFNLDKLLAELKKNILSAVSSGGIWMLDWDANDPIGDDNPACSFGSHRFDGAAQSSPPIQANYRVRLTLIAALPFGGGSLFYLPN